MFLYQSYDNFIEKTKAELNKEPEAKAGTGNENSTSAGEHSGIKTSAHRYLGPL